MTPPKDITPPYFYFYELHFGTFHSRDYSCVLALRSKIIIHKDIEGARESACSSIGYMPYIGATYIGYLTHEQYKKLIAIEPEKE